MSMSGGKSSSNSSTSSPYAAMLARYGVQSLKGAEPVMQQLLGQEGEALRTGGITNQIPIINRQVDAARQAAASSGQNTQEMLSKHGLANSAFGARIMAEQNAQSAQNVADVPANTIEGILSQAPQVAESAMGEGAGLLGTAGGLTRDIKSSGSSSNWGLSGDDIASLISASGGFSGGGGGSMLGKVQNYSDPVSFQGVPLQ